MTGRAGKGERGMLPSPELRLTCPWCPHSARNPATHVGLIDGRVVVSGCEWHMRLFRQRGELRAHWSQLEECQRRG